MWTVGIHSLILAFSLSVNAYAYDPCDVLDAFGSLAENQCYRIPQKLEGSHEGFTLSAVRLTQHLSTASEKDDVILIPGGPGTDAQGLALSLNKNRMLDAMWAHMGVNAVLYDPRGTGQSLLPKPTESYPPEVFSTRLQVEDLKKVIDSVSPTKPVFLLAHSAGGDLAAKYAALYPKRVKGLILYSASIDTREIGESNLRLFANDFAHWNEYLKTCPTDIAKKLKTKHIKIESFLRNVLKLQRIANVKPTKLQGRFYLTDFRVDLIKAIENDLGCMGRVPDVLNAWTDKIEALPQDIQTQVHSMRDVKFDPKNHAPLHLTRGTWIRTAVICSEGITKKEMKHDLWLEGLIFSQDTCFKVDAVYSQPPSRAWLSQIRTPTLLIGGTEDPYQIPSAVVRNHKAIVGSEMILIEGGGHESHLSHGVQFYKILEKFFSNFRRP